MPEKNINLKYRKFWLAIGYALVAFVLYSSLTSSPVSLEITHFDKYSHVFGYFVLMGWFAQIYHTKRSVIICAITFVFMGVGLEFVQGMTGYRYFDIYDMMANTLGVVIAWLLTLTNFPLILSYIENRIKNINKKRRSDL